MKQKNILQKKVQLFEDKQIFLFFAWGQAKYQVWGNLMSKKLIDFLVHFSYFSYNIMPIFMQMYYLPNLYFAEI